MSYNDCKICDVKIQKLCEERKKSITFDSKSNIDRYRNNFLTNHVQNQNKTILHQSKFKIPAITNELDRSAQIHCRKTSGRCGCNVRNNSLYLHYCKCSLCLIIKKKNYKPSGRPLITKLILHRQN